MIPKNKTGGVVTTTVLGVGGLLIAVIIVLVITSTLFGAGLFEESRRGTSQYNETTTSVMNGTFHYFGNYTLPGAVCTVVAVSNQTAHTAINDSNYYYNPATCQINWTMAPSLQYNNTIWLINSTTTYRGTDEITARDTGANLSEGLNNISEKIPTILLIVAVVFLFGALVILLRNASAMSIGVGGGSSL